jgi:hypothetical protein
MAKNMGYVPIRVAHEKGPPGWDVKERIGMPKTEHRQVSLDNLWRAMGKGGQGWWGLTFGGVALKR